VSKSVFDLMSNFKDEQRSQGHEIQSITIGPDKVLLDKLGANPTENPAVALWGIPVHTSEYMPKGCGIMQTCCHHTFFEQEADGGHLMHLAKRHTIILKFGAEGE
jgi:hypothetical protein